MTIWLVILTAVAHTLVLVGNLHCAALIDVVGESSLSWASQGQDIVVRMTDPVRGMVSTIDKVLDGTLQSAVLVSKLRQNLDLLLSAWDDVQEMHDNVIDKVSNMTGSLSTGTGGLLDQIDSLQSEGADAPGAKILNNIQSLDDLSSTGSQPTRQKVPLDPATNVANQVLAPVAPTAQAAPVAPNIANQILAPVAPAAQAAPVSPNIANQILAP
eukprot:CAMPEP_0194491920 /NCGR_PEP_ID=MMETSP0253-20130528/10658_1 /TAXON_ID=2966 /ORGANISM="Noctiluca scintillans" /LENGTH=213 /DNA_ID=CAMNT_0039332721 /DNA_START=56 /DNA_END=693 /DNA_ORIENTATION=+